MNANEITNKNKIKIDGKWFKVLRVWIVGDFVEISVSAGFIKFNKGQFVDVK